MIFEKITNPTEIIELKMKDAESIKIHLKGVDFRTEQYITSPVAKQYKTQEEVDMANAEYASRIIRNVVTKVEGIQFKIDGEIGDFEVQTDDLGQMTIESYTLFMRILNQCPEAIAQINGWYFRSVDLAGVEVKKK